MKVLYQGKLYTIEAEQAPGVYCIGNAEEFCDMVPKHLLKGVLEVKQEHIDRGHQHSCWRCPLALAFNTEFDAACVMRKNVILLKGDRYFSFFFDGPAVQFIEDFDAGKEVQPTTFTLEFK
jgi:hypothetical protein